MDPLMRKFGLSEYQIDKLYHSTAHAKRNGDECSQRCITSPIILRYREECAKQPDITNNYYLSLKDRYRELNRETEAQSSYNTFPNKNKEQKKRDERKRQIKDGKALADYIHDVKRRNNSF